MMGIQSMETDAAAPARSKLDISAAEDHQLLLTYAPKTSPELCNSHQADNLVFGERYSST